jgi:hypothetical protein
MPYNSHVVLITHQNNGKSQDGSLKSRPDPSGGNFQVAAGLNRKMKKS